MALRFVCYTFETETQDQVKEWYDSERPIKGGIQFLDLVFDNKDEAIDFVSDDTDKWSGAKVVRAKQTWVVGGWVD